MSDQNIQNILMSNEGSVIKLVFNCVLCGESQAGEAWQIPPPICDRCIKDLGEIILEKRKTNQP